MSMARQKTDGTRTSTRSPRKRSQAKRVSEPVISFSELDGIRYLHFGSPWVQGAMDIEHPDELVLSYIQDMMAWLLFLEPPAQVLQLGLGAAALTKFTHRHCPDTATTVVEISQQLPWVARQWFGLPPEDDRLTLVQGDAADFVGDPANWEGFGVIQVDLYAEEAAGPVHDGRPSRASWWSTCLAAMPPSHAARSASVPSSRRFCCWIRRTRATWCCWR